METDTHNIPINIGEEEFCMLVAALPFKDLITLYPSSPSEGRRGIVGSNNNLLSSCRFRITLNK